MSASFRTAAPVSPLAIRRSVIAFAALVVATLLGLMAFDSWRDYRRSIADAAQRTAALADSLQQHAARTVQAVDLALKSVADLVAYRSTGLALTNDELRALLIRRQIDAPQIRRLQIVDREGRLVADSDGLPAQPVDLADRAYFTAHRDNPSFGLYVGPPLRSRVDGEWFISVSRALRYADGSFAGVVLAVMEPGYFQDLYDRIREGGTDIRLLHADGTILVPVPGEGGAFVPPPRLPLEELGLGGRDATRIALLPDPTERIASLRRSGTLPLATLVAMPRADALANWSADVRLRALNAALIAIAVSLLAALLIRQIRRLEAAQATLLESEQRFELAVRGTSDGIWDWDPSADRCWYSPQFAALLGRAPETLPQTDAAFAALIHPEDRPGRDAALAAHLTERTPYDIEYRLRVG